MPSTDGGGQYSASLNPLAVVVFAAAVIVAALTAFSLPILRAMGLSFRAAFLLVCVVEFGTALVAGIAVMNFYSTLETT